VTGPRSTGRQCCGVVVEVVDVVDVVDVVSTGVVGAVVVVDGAGALTGGLAGTVNSHVPDGHAVDGVAETA